MQSAPPKLGTLLQEYGLITEEQIQYAVQEQKATGERLGECLIRLGLLIDTDLARALAKQVGLPFIDLRTFVPDREVLGRIPGQAARQSQILPLRIENGHINVAVADPFNSVVSDTVFRIASLPSNIYVAAGNELRKAIEKFYYLLEHPVDEEIEAETLRLRASPGADADVKNLLNMLLTSAVSSRATDIHITPSDVSTRIMLRIDGVMRLVHVFPGNLHKRLITNVKVRAGMDISEQRKPQDGRMTFEFLGDLFDIRVSSARTNFGENIVLRLLPSKGNRALGMRDLGFEPEQAEQLRLLFGNPYGMVLVTGPTGSGKTSTLYAALRTQDAIGKNIVTIEDPIEYEFLMIRQTQVNRNAGYTFSTAIRTFMRQDPDVILVGEIRDEETAIMATRAALTGHLLLSTLHTNTSIGALARMRDLGISPYLLANSLSGILAQRLVRRLCPNCKQPYSPPEELIRASNLPPGHTYYRPGRCDQCRDTGYLGRLAIAEILIVSGDIVHMIARDAPLGEIEHYVRDQGFVGLAETGRRKVLDGSTSIEELTRVIG